MKIIQSFIAIILVILFIALIIMYTMRQKNVPVNFVTAKGQDLYLGDNKFRSVGVNRYNLLTHNTRVNRIGCANPFSEEEIDAMFFKLHGLGITTVRFWLFQSFTNGGDDLNRLDYVIRVANKYDIKLIPVFENHWHNCTEGDVKSPSWYATGYLSPYGNYPLSLKEYIAKIVPRYKNNPTIMVWEIMNEARDADEKQLHEFAQDVSGYIKSLDQNHLVSLGMNGSKESINDYKKISTIKTIDILDYHDYDDNNTALPKKLVDIIAVSKETNKPLILGESGIKKKVKDRPRLFQNKMEAFYNNGGAVYMIWSYGEKYMTSDGYNFDSVDPLAKKLKDIAEEIKK